MTYLGILVAIVAFGVGVWGAFTHHWAATPFALFGAIVLYILFARRTRG